MFRGSWSSCLPPILSNTRLSTGPLVRSAGHLAAPTCSPQSGESLSPPQGPSAMQRLCGGRAGPSPLRTLWSWVRQKDGALVKVCCDGQGASFGLFPSSVCNFLYFSNLVSDKNQQISPVTHPSFRFCPFAAPQGVWGTSPSRWPQTGLGVMDMQLWGRPVPLEGEGRGEALLLARCLRGLLLTGPALLPQGRRQQPGRPRPPPRSLPPGPPPWGGVGLSTTKASSSQAAYLHPLPRPPRGARGPSDAGLQHGVARTPLDP